jgi:hypothetical protein
MIVNCPYTNALENIADEMYLTCKLVYKQKELAAAGMKMLLFALGILLLFAGSTGLYGQSVTISARFDADSIWIGEQTGFTITIEQPQGTLVNFPAFSDTLSDRIEILSVSPPDTIRTGGDKLRIKKSLRVTSFYQGTHYIGELPFVFMIENDQRVLHTRPAALEVLAPEVDSEAGIYDIKAPFGISLSLMEILPWILLLLLLGFIAWYLSRYYKQKKAGQPVFESRNPPEPSHAIAIRELRRLKSESLWQKGMVKEYYTRLTEILRRYIENRFGITAMEQTSSEIIRELRHNDDMAKDVILLLDQCFSIADLVKFARFRPDEENHDMCLTTAFHFVKATCEQVPVPDATVKQDDHAVNAQVTDSPHAGMEGTVLK